MKKIVLMIFITIIICLIILCYNPNNKYLGVYKNNINIEYFIKDRDEYKWVCTLSNDNLKLINEELTDSIYKVTYKSNNNGKTIILCSYNNDIESKYKISYLVNIDNNKIYWLESSSLGLLEYPDLY